MLPEEQTLVTKAQNGDHEAFDRLVGQYRRRVFHFCFELLGSVEDAEDAAQEACERAWRSLGSFRGDARLFTWLSSIALNACRNTLRARSGALRRKTTSLDDPQNCHLADQPYPGPSVEEQVFGPPELVLERVIANAEGRWDKRDYDLFLLRYGEGRTYEEIAQILGVPASTLRSRHRDRIEPVLEVLRQERAK